MPDYPEVVDFSEANKCPECGHTGKILHSNPIVGGTVHMLQCRTEVCPWYMTNWVVETDANGQVMVNKEAMAKAKGERLLAPRDPSFDAAFEGVHAMLNRQLREETQRPE